jgi:hypothetical protein
MNQLATPGLGSVMAGRRVAGTGQLLLAVAGFVLVIGWFGLTASNTYNQIVNDAEPRPAGWLGEAGGVSFMGAWVWAWVTSFQILRCVQEKEPTRLPPRLS